MRLMVIIFGLAFILGQATMAQELSHDHVIKINSVDNPVKKLKLYRRYFHRDSAQWAKQMERRWKDQNDSLSDAIAAREKALEQKSKAVKDGIQTKIYNTVYRPWARKLAKEELRWLHEQNVPISVSAESILLNYFEHYFLQASQDEKKLLTLKQRLPDIPLPKQLSSKLNTYTILNPEKVNGLKQLARGKFNAASGVDKMNSFNIKAHNLSEKFQDYSGKVNEYGEYAKTFINLDSAKSFAQARGEEIASTYVSRLDGFSELGKAQGELSKLKGLPGEYKGQMENLRDSAYIKQQAKQKAEELAMNYMAEHPEIIQGVQKKMALLMKKYSVVPNSNDLNTAVKRTSLKGRPFKQRLYFASNFQVPSLAPVTIDFSPMVGYRFNTRFLAGVGGNYRQAFKDSIPTLSPTVFGYKVFSSYDVVKNFFACAEFDRNSPGVKKTETGTQLTWKNAAFLGIGRRMMIHHKVDMTVVMMYNFVHEHKDPIYPRPWVVRIGFQTSELAMVKPKARF